MDDRRHARNVKALRVLVVLQVLVALRIWRMEPPRSDPRMVPVVLHWVLVDDPQLAERVRRGPPRLSIPSHGQWERIGPFTVESGAGRIVRPVLPGRSREYDLYSSERSGYLCIGDLTEFVDGYALDVPQAVLIECWVWDHGYGPDPRKAWELLAVRRPTRVTVADDVAATRVATRVLLGWGASIGALFASLAAFVYVAWRRRADPPWVEAFADGGAVTLDDGRRGRINAAYTGPVLVASPSLSMPFRGGEIAFAQWRSGTLANLAWAHLRRERFVLGVAVLGLVVTIALGISASLRLP